MSEQKKMLWKSGKLYWIGEVCADGLYFIRLPYLHITSNFQVYSLLSGLLKSHFIMTSASHIIPTGNTANSIPYSTIWNTFSNIVTSLGWAATEGYFNLLSSQLFFLLTDYFQCMEWSENGKNKNLITSSHSPRQSLQFACFVPQKKLLQTLACTQLNFFQAVWTLNRKESCANGLQPSHSVVMLLSLS